MVKQTQSAVQKLTISDSHKIYLIYNFIFLISILSCEDVNEKEIIYYKSLSDSN